MNDILNNGKISINELLSQTSFVTGFSIGDICSASRKEELVDARQAFTMAALDEGYGPTDIGQAINRDHSSAIHLRDERPVTKNTEILCDALMRVRDNIISIKARQVAENPNDEKLKQELKSLL